MLSDAALRAEIGAGYYVTSLRETVEACLGLARVQAGKRKPRGGSPPRPTLPAEPSEP